MIVMLVTAMHMHFTESFLSNDKLAFVYICITINYNSHCEQMLFCCKLFNLIMCSFVTHIQEMICLLKKDLITLKKETKVLFLVMMSHGNDGVIVGTDGNIIELEEVTDAVCIRELTGIPKIVVFQSCRGGIRAHCLF